MATEDKRGGGEGADNPLLAQLVVVRMEDIMDKLKLLEYERNFCKKLRIKPLPRHYFALITNPGEQFHYFTNLAVWLINQSGTGGKLDQPQEYDDPNATITTIITRAKQMGISTNFPPAKLKTGTGEYVCRLLSELTDQALAGQHFKWKKPVHPEEDSHEEIIQDPSSELNTNQLEEEINEEMLDSDEEEGEAIYLDLQSIAQHDRSVDRTGLSSPGVVFAGALQSNIDPQQWRLEVERVMPSLKVHLRQDNRDWRVHYKQMHEHHDSIKTVLSDIKVHLDKLHKDIGRTQEKISSREKYINSQLEHRITDLRAAQDQLAEVRERYKESSTGVNDMARTLAQVTAELEGVKMQMDEKGTSMTDSGPVVLIRQALTRLKNDCKEMEVQIGVMEHSLLVARCKSKSALKMQMTADVGPF